MFVCIPVYTCVFLYITCVFIGCGYVYICLHEQAMAVYTIQCVCVWLTIMYGCEDVGVQYNISVCSMNSIMYPCPVAHA